MLKSLPDTPEHNREELNFQITLGPVLMATKGYTVPEVEAAYVRAHELCLQIGDTLQLFPVLWGLWAFYHVQARYQTARELGERCLSLAQGAQDPVFLLGAHYALGQTAFWLGEPVSARAHIERCVALDHVRYHASYRHLYGFDIGAVGQCYVPWTLWLLGHADQALTKMHEALTLIQERSQHYILAWALDFIATLHQFRRENHASRERAEAAITLSNEQGYPYWLGVGTILRGWALAEQGQGEEGVRQIRQGISTYQATGAELNRPYFLALLAEAHGKIEETEEGLTVLAEALAFVDKTGERYYEAELYRLKGELTLQKEFHVPGSTFQVGELRSLAPDVQGEAEACFLKAIEIARKQQAKSLELRAVMSLARLWQQQGKQKEAHQMLSEIYNWFTEGFDTKDLQEAKALLQELSDCMIESSSH